MKPDTKSNIVMFTSGLICTTVAMTILVNSDSKLKVRAQRQLSMFLDTTGRFLSFFADIADQIVGPESRRNRTTEEVGSQWTRVDQARKGD